MINVSGFVSTILLFCCLGVVPAAGQAPDFDAILASQKKAMMPLSMMDGTWEGTATTLTYSGERIEIRQTERVGSFLDGTVKMIEGKGFDDSDNVTFNALGIISFDPQTEQYLMRSYARGMVGDFEFQPTSNGFEWKIPAGPTVIHYKATIENDTWTETGDRVMADGSSVRFFEMTLTRTGSTEWPDE